MKSLCKSLNPCRLQVLKFNLIFRGVRVLFSILHIHVCVSQSSKMIQNKDRGVGYFQEASLHTRIEKEKENIHAWPIVCLKFLIRCRVDALDLTL